MKINFKKHWQAITAFVVGGAMCLGMGIFMLASPSAQTQLETNANSQTELNSTQDVGELLLVSADGSQNNGGTSKEAYLTVSQWNEVGVYGGIYDLIEKLKPKSADDPASNAIWAEIQNSALWGNVTIYTVTVNVVGAVETYSIPLKVVGGSPISASGNVLTIAGTDFTVCNSGGSGGTVESWTGIPAIISGNDSAIVTGNITITASFVAQCTITFAKNSTASWGNGTWGTLTKDSVSISTLSVPYGSTLLRNGNNLTIVNPLTNGTNYTITATATSGYHLADWKYTLGGVTNYLTEKTLTQNITLTADFFPNNVTAMGIYTTGNDYPNVINWNTYTVQYEPYAGYTWMTFEQNPTTNSPRWIVIGGGNTTYQPASMPTGADANAFASSNQVDGLGATELLMFREKTLAGGMLYDIEESNKGRWTSTNGYDDKASLNKYLNGDYLSASDISSISSNIVYEPMKTAWYTGTEIKLIEGGDWAKSRVFLLATKWGKYHNLNNDTYTSTYGAQNFCVESYLGNSFITDNATSITNCKKYYYFMSDSGDKSQSWTPGAGSYWWLRSGGYDSSNIAYCVNSLGRFGDTYVNFSYGVRPAFVLNLG